MAYNCSDVCDAVYRYMCDGCEFERDCHPNDMPHDDRLMVRCLDQLVAEITGPHSGETAMTFSNEYEHTSLKDAALALARCMDDPNCTA